MAAHVISLKPHSFPIRWLPRASCPRTTRTEAGRPRPPSPEGRDSRSMQTRRDKMSRNKPPNTFPQLQPRVIPKASLRWGVCDRVPSGRGALQVVLRPHSARMRSTQQTRTHRPRQTHNKMPGKAPAWFRGEGSPFSHRCILVSPPTREGYRSLASKEEL